MNGIGLAVAIAVSMLIGFILGEGYGYWKGYEDRVWVLERLRGLLQAA